jgi:hypothetical protein
MSKEAKQQGPTLEEIKRMTPEQAEEAIMKFSRAWAMPTADTFDCKPIGEFVRRYLQGVSVDPFARNKRLATLHQRPEPDHFGRAPHGRRGVPEAAGWPWRAGRLHPT